MNYAKSHSSLSYISGAEVVDEWYSVWDEALNHGDEIMVLREPGLRRTSLDYCAGHFLVTSNVHFAPIQSQSPPMQTMWLLLMVSHLSGF